ncbi:MAG: 2-oxoacid:acceptor oxidoreductase family protein [Elusimicrobiota bacterium]
MNKKIIISGFGGQGVLFTGTLLCQAGMEEGKHVTFFPSYGAEMRGGTANCQVIISDSPIGSPAVASPHILLSFNKPSFLKFSDKVKENGIIAVNSSLFKPENLPAKVNTIKIPANELAEECGSHLVMNAIMLGALMENTRILKFSSLIKAVPALLTGKKKKFIKINKKALQKGKTYVN